MAEDEDEGKAAQARSARMETIENMANRAWERMTQRVRRHLALNGEVCKWTLEDAGKLMKTDVEDVLAEDAHRQGVSLEKMKEFLSEVEEHMKPKLRSIEWMPADLVRRVTTPVTVTELLKLTRYLERRVQLLGTEEASNKKQTAIVEYGSKLHDFADAVLQLSTEEQALSTAVIDGGKIVQSMDKLFAARVQTSSEIESREGISLKQKQAAKAEVEKAGKAVTEAKKALAKATRREDSIGQHLTGDTRLGFTSYNDLVAELNMIAAMPDDSRKKVRFSGGRDEAEDRSMHALSQGAENQ